MKAPAFQCYAADFLADMNVAMMSAEEVGAYWLLILYCWREGTLPDDVEELALLARMQPEAFSRSWEKRIRRCFEQNGEGHWVHPRLESERNKQAENRDKKIRAANARHHPEAAQPPRSDNADAMQMHSTRKADGYQTQCPSSASSSSSASANQVNPNLSSDAPANGADAPAASPSDFTVLGYLRHLKTLPAFDHIDPEGEASLVKLWHEKPKNKKRRITKRFLEEWAKRIERPLVEASPQNGSPPAANLPPELSAEDLQAQINDVAAMLDSGRTLQDIHSQLGAAIRPAQWRQIASAATAQAKKKPKASESPPAQPGNVVPMARAHR